MQIRAIDLAWPLDFDREPNLVRALEHGRAESDLAHVLARGLVRDLGPSAPSTSPVTCSAMVGDA